MRAVLVVEDEPLIRLAAVDLVDAAGFEALDAANADQAIRILEQRSDIRLIFSDVDMPGTMDGLKLAHYVRGRWPPIHIIIASGQSIIEQAAMPSGAVFFAKPYHAPTIAKAIASMIGEADL